MKIIKKQCASINPKIGESNNSLKSTSSMCKAGDECGTIRYISGNARSEGLSTMRIIKICGMQLDYNDTLNVSEKISKCI